MNEQENSRGRMLGSLIREARHHASRTAEECALMLGLTPEEFAAAEAGEHIVSLPELEVLAIYLDVPMAHFWGSHQLEQPAELDYQALLALRHKIVGGLLRQARLDAGYPAEELADAVGIEAGTLEQYERGEVAIPYLVLETLARELGKTVDLFLDDSRGPLGRHEAAKTRQRRFQEMPLEMQTFIVRPANISYLETAMRLSELDADKLRTIAASLLEITY
ncbi:MAG: helix-turn-helix transcriptional regulator [Anaerolineae bacterium]|nr:helix-turn-helix transcriptional regulator [Anaerolineae bacterium]